VLDVAYRVVFKLIIVPYVLNVELHFHYVKNVLTRGKIKVVQIVEHRNIMLIGQLIRTFIQNYFFFSTLELKFKFIEIYFKNLMIRRDYKNYNCIKLVGKEKGSIIISHFYIFSKNRSRALIFNL